jgi:Tfp pilus assembly protein PilF
MLSDICTMDRMERVKEMLLAQPNDNFLRHALALEYIKEGNDVEARTLFEGILTDSPDYIGSYYHLGKLLERAGETQLAISWYEKGMQYAKQTGSRHAYNELQTAYEDLTY